jgi:hypothetical protein
MWPATLKRVKEQPTQAGTEARPMRAEVKVEKYLIGKN